VPSQQLSLLVPKHGVRRPSRSSRFSVRSNLANVDLRSHGVRLQQNFLASGSLNRIRYIWTGDACAPAKAARATDIVATDRARRRAACRDREIIREV